jgi:uncharacterized protein YjdB
MKRLIYILSIIFFTSACFDEIGNEKVIVDADGKVRVEFSVIIPDAGGNVTKAMAEQPQLERLFLAVFNEAGYIEEYVSTDLSAESNDKSIYTFTASLTSSASPRIIHFIGNGPARENIEFGTEEEDLAKIFAKRPEDMYWQRLVVETISKDNISEALSFVKLVRNFAKISLAAGSNSGITVKRFKVVNTYDKGYAAAYNVNTADFVEFFDENNKIKDIGNLSDYIPLIPTSASLISLNDAEWMDLEDEDTSNDSYYAYERELPLDNPVYIIAQLEYGNEGDSAKSGYFKLELTDKDGNYFPLIRNHEYLITINAVIADGYNTPEDAALSTSGNVSTSLGTASLTYISDGIASLEVDYTEKVVTISSDNQQPVARLNFEFKPDAGGTVDNSLVNATVNSDQSASGPAISNIVNSETYKTDGYIDVALNTTSSITKTQSITLTGKYTLEDGTSSYLSRKVRFIVMPKQTMTVTCVPGEVEVVQNAPFELHITLPGGLPSSMFPLELCIESERGTVQPNESLPCVSQESISGSGKPSYHYVKTLNWADYLKEGGKDIICRLKSNTAKSASTIFVKSEHFNLASTTFSNYEAKKFTNLAFSEDVNTGEGQPVDFSFTITDLPADGSIYVTLTGIEPKDGSSLTYDTVIDGKARYIFTPESIGTHTLNFLTTSTEGYMTVKLEAHHFTTATCRKGKYDFSNISLDVASVNTGQTTQFVFNFDSDDLNTERSVILYFSGAAPIEGNSQLVENSDGSYAFIPVYEGPYTIDLTTTSIKDNISVTIVSDNYTETTVSALRRIRGKVTYAEEVESSLILNPSDDIPILTEAGKEKHFPGTYNVEAYEYMNVDPDDVYSPLIKNRYETIGSSTVTTSLRKLSKSSFWLDYLMELDIVADFTGNKNPSINAVLFSFWYVNTFRACRFYFRDLYDNFTINLTQSKQMASPDFIPDFPFVYSEDIILKDQNGNIINNGAIIEIENQSQHQLSAAIIPDNVTTKGIIWESSDSSIATVTSDGLVETKSVGKVTITAKTKDGQIEKSCMFDVIVPVTGVTLNYNSKTIFLNESLQLAATISPNDATYRDVQWESSNPAVATVDENGLVTAHEVGEARITVSTVNGNFTASCDISVRIRITKIDILEEEINLYKGETHKLTVNLTPSNAVLTDVSWDYTNSEVATVDENGIITAITGGTTRILAYYDDGKNTIYDQCRVNVKVKITGITLSQTELTLGLGQSKTLSATLTPADASTSDIRWKSRNPDIATVDENTGLVSAFSVGNTIITAYYTDDETILAECLVTITEEYKGYEVILNDQWQLSSTASNPNSNSYDGVYESFSNRNTDSSAAIMYIDIIGYNNFELHVRSYAESGYDFVVVSNLDCELSSYNTTSGSDVKMTTSNNNSSSAYQKVVFDDIDGQKHRITIMYRKDGSRSSNDDCGYLLIPKNQ